MLQKQPMRAEYEVTCNAAWQTRRVRIQQRLGRRSQGLTLRVDRNLCWWQGSRPFLRLRGCEDVDLMVTPITNTLPIRRLQLKIGQSAEVTAAWIRFPELRVQRLSQRYTRLARDRYHYQSDTGFSTELVVDDFGLVTLYPAGWQRIALQ